MADWKGRIAVVTGGSRGIGRAIALELGQRGATVIVNYNKSADAANEVVEAVKAAGGDGMAVQADVCLLYTSPSPRDRQKSRMPSSA